MFFSFRVGRVLLVHTADALLVQALSLRLVDICRKSPVIVVKLSSSNWGRMSSVRKRRETNRWRLSVNCENSKSTLEVITYYITYMDASIFDSALSHTRRSDAAEKKEENSVSTFGRFRRWTIFQSSPVSVKVTLFSDSNILWDQCERISYSQLLLWFYCFPICVNTINFNKNFFQNGEEFQNDQNIRTFLDKKVMKIFALFGFYLFERTEAYQCSSLDLNCIIYDSIYQFAFNAFESGH